MFAITSTEELDKVNQIAIKQLKNRYNDPNSNKRFVIGVDRSKMKLYDVENSSNDLVDSNQDDVPVFDKSSFGSRMKDFSDIKV